MKIEMGNEIVCEFTLQTSNVVVVTKCVLKTQDHIVQYSAAGTFPLSLHCAESIAPH